MVLAEQSATDLFAPTRPGSVATDLPSGLQPTQLADQFYQSNLFDLSSSSAELMVEPTCHVIAPPRLADLPDGLTDPTYRRMPTYQVFKTADADQAMVRSSRPLSKFKQAEAIRRSVSPCTLDTLGKSTERVYQAQPMEKQATGCNKLYGLEGLVGLDRLAANRTHFACRCFLS